MRPIKFRAWDKLKNRMLKVQSVAFSDSGEVTSIYTYGADFSNDKQVLMGEKPDLDSAVLEQYTGLKDTYGKEIYEGDIVRGYYQEPDRDDGYDGSSMVKTVNFRWGSFWLGDFKNQIMLYTPPIIEVVGNVHTDGDLIDS